ncbi:MAG: MerR family transcriptional regulator [Polaromonas sp.]|nr:MerR family transcriptional regulator [Gemmatimonadaceae bacterium]
MTALPPLGSERAGHPIAVVAERTGLSQDVLRVWERRYGAVQPIRGPGGQRFYSDADVQRLGLLNAAIRAGRSIGQVARLSTEEIATLVEEDMAARDRRALPTSAVPGAVDIVESAFILARSLDASALDETLRRAVAVMGVSPFIELVVGPLLRRVGEEWHAGRLSLAPEHLVSSILHDIIAGTMRAFPQRAGAPRVLIATPAGDRHAIGAAIAGAAAAVEGWNVLYLGPDLPAQEIADAASAADVRVVALSVVYVDDVSRVLGELRALRTRLPATVTIIAGGAGARSIAAELAAIDVLVEASIPGLVAQLRRIWSG